MPEEPIPFPLVSAPGANPYDSAGRLRNCFAEPLVTGARAQFAWRRAPGLSSFKLASYTGWRGAIQVGSLLYAAWTSGSHAVASYTTGGVETLLGTQGSGTKKVFWAHNSAATPDVVYVDPDNGAFQVTVAPAVIAYPDADVGSPNSVCFLDGYFFFTHGDGTCIASGINTTAVNPLDFVKIDGNEGGLLRAIAFGELYLCGTDNIDVWQNTAEPVGFPFSRVKVIPRGLLGRYAISGFEKGFGKGLIFVGDNRVVYILDGYNPVKISTPDVDRAISSFLAGGGSVDDIEMFPYVVGGHSCVVLRSPSWTWVFDTDQLYWHERWSQPHLFFRGFGSVFAFNKWLCGDADTANILQINDAVYDELGNNIVYEIESGPVTDFPNRMRVNQATFAMARGVGQALGLNPQQTDPTVLIQWTDDGGMHWSTPVQRKLGPQETNPGPVRVNRAGVTKDQGRRWKLTVYDPVDVELTGGTQSDQPRNY
jgi:hypothetical protein